MYKYSKDGVSVLTVLDKRKQKMNGLFPIKVQVIHNRKQKYYSTRQEVSIRDWEVLPHTKNRHLSEIRRNHFCTASQYVCLPHTRCLSHRHPLRYITPS